MSTGLSGRCVNLAAGNSGQPRINQLARDGLDAAFEKVLKLIQETELLYLWAHHTAAATCRSSC